MGEVRRGEQGGPPQPPLEAWNPVRSGQRIAGRYVTRGVLGRGGMGVVYHAVEEEIEREVALKFILVDPSMGAEAREAYDAQFKREAQALGSLPPHPNRVVLYQYGQDAQTELRYMAMELVRGEQLSEVIRDRALRVEQVMSYARQMARALVDVHASGLVHRDLKPENLIVTRGLLGDEQLKLIDFGIARAPIRLSEVSEEESEEHELHGTVLYMAPELLVDGVQDARTDIYALGVILFELVSGVGPFAHLLESSPGEDAMELARHHVESAPGALRPRAGLGEVPAGLEEVIGRCLAKEPEERFADARALLTALEALSRPAPQVAAQVLEAAAERRAEVRVAPPEDGGAVVVATALSGATQRVAAADASGVTRIWEVRSGREVWTIPAPEGGEGEGEVTRLAFASDGRMLALGDRRGRLWLCDVELRSREQIVLVEGGPQALSFDRAMGLMVVGTTAGTIEVWDLPNCKRIAKIHPEVGGRRARPGEIACVALSPQRHYLVAGFTDGGLWVWNFLDKSLSGALQAPPPLPGSMPQVRGEGRDQEVVYAGTTPDGKRVGVLRAGGYMEVWDPIQRTLEGRIALQESEPPRRFLFGPDNAQALVAYNSGIIATVDVVEGAVLDTIRIPRGRAVSVAYDADGAPLASIARGATAQVWEVLRRRRVQTVGPYRSPLLDLTIAPYGETVLTLAEGGFLDRWDLLTGRHLGRLHTGANTAFSLNKAPEEGRLLLCSAQEGLMALEGLEVNGIGPIRRVKLPVPPPQGGRQARSYAISRDQRFVAMGFDDGSVSVYAYSEVSDPLVLEGSSAPALALAFSPDNRTLAVGHEDGRVLLWDLAATAVCWEEASGGLPVRFVAWTPSGRLLSIPRGETVEVWNMESRRRVARLTGHEGPIRTMVHGLDGRLLLTASDDGTARLWDVAAQGTLRVLDDHPGPVTAATLDPQLRLLLTTSGPFLSIWRVSDAALLGRFAHLGAERVGEGAAASRWAAWSPTGHYIASRRMMSELELVHPESRRPLTEEEAQGLLDPRAVAARLVVG